MNLQFILVSHVSLLIRQKSGWNFGGNLQPFKSVVGWGVHWVSPSSRRCTSPSLSLPRASWLCGLICCYFAKNGKPNPQTGQRFWNRKLHYAEQMLVKLWVHYEGALPFGILRSRIASGTQIDRRNIRIMTYKIKDQSSWPYLQHSQLLCIHIYHISFKRFQHVCKLHTTIFRHMLNMEFARTADEKPSSNLLRQTDPPGKPTLGHVMPRTYLWQSCCVAWMSMGESYMIRTTSWEPKSTTLWGGVTLRLYVPPEFWAHLVSHLTNK